MAQTGYTPLLTYASGTASNVPLAANLTSSASGAELALNYADGKLFYKDSGGVVQVLATKATGSIGGSTTQVQYNLSGALAGSANMTFNGTRLTVADLADSGLTSGRVVYASAGGALVDSANLTFDGTTLTANALTTTSTVTINGGTANGVAYLNGSKVLTTGSALTFDGTNLQVGGNSQPIIRAVSSSTNNATARLFTDGDTVYVGSANTSTTGGSVPVVFQIGGSEQMRLTSTGLGIGTSSITAGFKLDVNGNARIGSGAAQGLEIQPGALTYLSAYNRTTSVYVPLDISGEYLRFSTNNGAEKMRLDSSGNLGIGTSSPSNKLVVSNAGANGFEVDPANSLMQTYNRSSGAYTAMNLLALSMAFKTGASPATTMLLDSSGNLGIGTSSPSTYSAKLAVVSTAADTRISVIDDVANGRGGYLRSNYSDALVLGTTSGVRDLVFSPDNAERMRINTTGNVGIGTSSPVTKLHVNTGAAGYGITIAASSQTGNLYQIGIDSNSNLAVYDTTASAQRLVLSLSGNLGLGVTPSAWSSSVASQVGYGAALSSRAAGNTASDMTHGAYWNGTNWLYQYSSVGAARYQMTGANAGSTHAWFVSAGGTAGNAITFTQAMTLDASGNLTVGNTSPAGSSQITAYGASNGQIAVQNSTNWSRLLQNSNDLYIDNGVAGSAGNIIFRNSSSTVERARITSGGDLLVGTTSNPALAWTSANRALVDQAAADFPLHVRNSSTTAANNYGIAISFGGTPNGTGNAFVDGRDATAQRFTFRSNGGLANYSANNVNLSDRREKTNFAPAKSYLDTICAIPVQTFNYIDQSEDDPGLTLGVVAQDVQAVAPELVMESNWGTKDNPKMRLSIYQTDLQYALMKALQELKAEFDAYKATHP